MITLGNYYSNTHKLKLTTSAATQVDFHLSGAERKAGGTITEMSRQDRITTATTTDIVDQNLAGIKTTINYISIKNNDAVTSNTITVLYFDGTNNLELYKTTLAAGERCEYTSGGFV